MYSPVNAAYLSTNEIWQWQVAKTVIEACNLIRLFLFAVHLVLRIEFPF